MVALAKAFRFTDWPVRRKFIALLVAASLLPLGVAAVLDIRATRDRLLGHADDLLTARADELVGRIEMFHRGYQLSAAELAGLPAVIALLRASGGAAPLARLAVHGIANVHVSIDRNLRAIAVLDASGKVIATTEPRMDGKGLADRAFVRDALPGRATISDIHVADPELGALPVVSYTAPVWDEAGVAGLVVLWIRAEAVWELARSANERAGPGSFAVVFDEHGIRIAHTSSRELMFRPGGALAPELVATLVAERRFGPETEKLLHDVRPSTELFLRARAATPDPGLFRAFAPANQQWNHGVARRLKAVTWTIVYLLPERAVDEQIAAMTRDKVILAVVIMALAFGVGLGLAAAILRPVVSLSAATQVIASGDLSARVPLLGGDELGRLCASFNAMAERIERDDAALRRSRDELEDRVAERTAELVRASVTEARAREALEASTARLEILAHTAHELAGASGDARLVLELATRRIGEVIGDACGIRLISDDGEWLEPAETFYHPDPAKCAFGREAVAHVRQRLGEGVGGRVAATGEPLLIPEITVERVVDMAPAFRAMIERIGASSLLTLPLRSRERLIGVVSLMRGTHGRPYTVDDQRFAQEVADRAGLAIDNAVLVATLERRVAARTAALEAANDELEAFSYSVSHDLRAPLRTIDAFSHALLSDHGDQLGGEAQRHLQRIRDATHRMAGLIDDLLNLARLTRANLRWTAVDLTALAGEVVDELRRQEPERATSVHVAPGVAGRGDARLLTIVLQNMLGNAWKFTAKHPDAEIWFGAELSDNRTVYYVRDTGAGFDMKYADKLFAPFHRLHGASDYDGVGVGLATVKRIVTRHGGRIWAEAAVDRGATFFFTLGRPP